MFPPGAWKAAGAHIGDLGSNIEPQAPEATVTGEASPHHAMLMFEVRADETSETVKLFVLAAGRLLSPRAEWTI